MTPEQISRWVTVGESETQEFKETTGQRREAAKAVCAMLNHRGGRVLFGVRPDRVVAGQIVGADTLEDTAQELQRVDPPAFPSIDAVGIGGGRAVIVVTVPSGSGRPYSYQGQAYRRVGATSLRLSRDEYNEMLLERVHADRRWENEEATGWAVADLDHDQIAETVAEAVRRGRLDEPGTREPELLLRGLHLLRGGRLLRAAVVLFGRSEEMAATYPQCLLRVARFRGTSRTEFLDSRQFHGHAFDLLRISGFWWRACRSRAGCCRVCSSAWMTRSILPKRSVKPWRTPSATGTTPWEAALSGSGSTTTGSKSRQRVRCALA